MSAGRYSLVRRHSHCVAVLQQKHLMLLLRQKKYNSFWEQHFRKHSKPRISMTNFITINKSLMKGKANGNLWPGTPFGTPICFNSCVLISWQYKLAINWSFRRWFTSVFTQQRKLPAALELIDVDSLKPFVQWWLLLFSCKHTKIAGDVSRVYSTSLY